MITNVLPDDVLLQTFHWYLDEDPSYTNPEELEEWQTLVHVSKMAKCCSRFTTSPEPAASLRWSETCEGDVGCLAILPHRHLCLDARSGPECHRGIRKQ